MIHILLSLTLLTPASPSLLSETLTLSTGEQISAQYNESTDSYCLELELFGELQADQLNAHKYWEARLSRQRALFIEQLKEVQAAHKRVHTVYLEEQEILKTELGEAYKQRDLARSDLWWWRGATIGLILTTGVTAAYLIGR